MIGEIPENAEPIGYQAIIQQFQLKTLPHFSASYVVSKGAKQFFKESHQEIRLYPKGYALKDSQDPFLHLEFAFKHEGMNLEILKNFLEKIEKKKLVRYIKGHPFGQTARKLWYLYETLTQIKLALADVRQGDYIDLLDPKQYYTAVPTKQKRYRICDNLLGNKDFCPFIRRTAELQKYEKKQLDKIAQKMCRQYDDSTLQRAIHYLYTKETMSSWEIEREQPSKKRLERFVDLLRKSGQIHTLNEKELVVLQQAIVDPRFAENKFRDFQNYIGQEFDFYRQKIHYISPKPEDVLSMMDGFFKNYNRMISSTIHPVIAATALSFGFVFIHPFEDGNGRLHRFIIHHILARLGFTPPGIIFPVSASILKEIKRYDDALERISTKLMPLIEYSMTAKGEMTVQGSTDTFYRYLDYTHLAEFLFERIEQTIQTDFKEELNYIASYDRAKQAIQEVVDLPDRKLDLMIHFVMQNKGHLSLQKQKSHFQELTKAEIEAIEGIIQSEMSQK